MSAAGLLGSLPAPKREHIAPPPKQSVALSAVQPRVVTEPPPYGSRERRAYIPRRPSDFGDGGAFPEVHLPQFPRDMGRKDKSGGRAAQTLAMTVGASGGASYDAIVKQGANRDKWIASDHSALVPKLDSLKDEMALPDDEELTKTAAETAAALGLVVDSKIAAAQPKTLPKQPGAPTYIKYTPAQQGPQYNSGASQRIIKMQDMPIDPMDPPKFRHKKVPRASGDVPVPVMHSPPRATTVKDQQDWKIPPCISNWKNPKGYTIPLDKRLAADGRGLQEVQINDQFAKLTEALYVAEGKAREAVDMRQKVVREQKLREKEAKEAELRDLAVQARLRGAGGAVASAVPAAARGEGYLPPPPPMAGGYGEGALPPPPPRGGSPEDEEERETSPPRERETREEREERRAREDLRRERQRERERERRLEARDAHGGKRSKLTRDRDRDISEKVALGQAKVTGTGEAMYDQRLFNQEGGMGHGLTSDDAYNLYDKQLFADRAATGLHRAKAADDEDAGGEEEGTRRFRPDKGFDGVDYGAAAQGPTGPVQFERDAPEEDPFGLNSFISDAGKKKGALDGIGRGGGMAAGGGGSGADFSNRSRVDFQSSGT
mmetsp:Transcript_14857/g.44890  ORF Transcript_14857/g.44890 Transcript_14857/m.44890 type:complete len:605 (+) Transcript_14857:242-2056(+)|eukprot:CAMPEP_0206143120 /NCGR_PEP_ID=MMETSP1473-20131121/19358_1 /ASSEMBLY_ACC=CAM_ASM_001109 /TAXON_ID=1461547 /ORGANISM="Stichococcus sp, Strain RCC1054" /LENGTH=604 /DNA_ID=CAMNT_0053538385 /DNA_START=131 /DNA_END=1945 /DNA_ORIENTATION=-